MVTGGQCPVVALLQLEAVDSVDVTVVIDNSLDILVPGTPVAQRPPWTYEWSQRDQLIAEHGYSLLVTVHRAGRSHTLLYDAGLGEQSVLRNLEVLGKNVRDIRAVVLSHGHVDHHGGLAGLAKRLGRGLPFILHPDALRDRRVVFPGGVEIHMPPPGTAALAGEGWDIVEERAPSLLLEGCVLVSGQIARTTDFEKGFPLQQARTESGWEPDTWIYDDQAVIVNVRGLGLVVLSSCSHAGAINVIRYAQEITGVDQLHAFVGGMHLTGGLFEAIIPRTVAELKLLAPSVVVPGHCTGWRANGLVAAELPDAYLWSNVGTTYHFAAPE
ncbi:hypothetical protein AYO38_09605 [bacterium SCGC AG-212-C10]|nr:hypothetical protein AYO38_09605 [bacterium SCGC AG-212-C10]